MVPKKLLLIVLGWILFKLFEHYILNYYLVPFSWIGVSVFFLGAVIFLLVQIIIKRKNLSKNLIATFVIFFALFFLTIDCGICDGWIEKADWHLLRGKRTEIVNDVLKGKLKPNVDWNGVICKLPYQFPIVSHGGNEIVIEKNKDKTTVQFYIYRGIFNAPTSKFIYTNDLEKIKFLEGEIKYDPTFNYKIENNWYSI